jgi:alkanesulfonate monooxygenase SsuD/methylene tetrahydromethanopterin reductase-like flavin-dependent oxidoreductase (luciferase family)
MRLKFVGNVQSIATLGQNLDTKPPHHTIGFRYRQSTSGFVAEQTFRDRLPDSLGGLFAMRFDLSGMRRRPRRDRQGVVEPRSTRGIARLRRAVDQRGAFRARKPNLSVADPACNCASDADTHDPYRLLSSGLAAFRTDRLAEEIATLDVLSEGRVDLGVSRGNTSRYFEAWGLDYEDRSNVFTSCFGRLIRYWTEAKVEVGSRTESIEPKCIQQPHPPVYVATYREDAAAWVGKRGFTLFQGSQQSVDSIRRCIRAFKDAGGNVTNVPIGRFVVVGETDEATRRAARPAADKLTAGYRRSGFLGNLPQTEVVRTLELFAREVRPRLQLMQTREKRLAVDKRCFSQRL